MDSQNRSRYLIASEIDLKWGMIVTSVGRQKILPGEDYPNHDHPTRYLFTVEKGRILSEYQLVYIISGKGTFWYGDKSSHCQVSAGDMLVLRPGDWHSYCPDPETGWEECWIGFEGTLPNSWSAAGYIPQQHVLRPGVRNDIVSIYDEAVGIAMGQKHSYQQVLSSMASMILYWSVYYDRNRAYDEDDSVNIIVAAKSEILSRLKTITPEDLASILGLGYSKFRKLFKEYTRIAPGRYILELRVAKAKELLTNTSMQIQEIAWECGFENPDYFNTAFKRVAQATPGDFRKSTRTQIQP